MPRALFSFIETNLKGAFLIKIHPFEDDRGKFFRTFSETDFREVGLDKPFLQINQSINFGRGTFRGIHYQQPPPGDCKLIRCISGKVLDIIVDIREGSETFMQVYTTELAPDLFNMIYITEGFAHGFLTLEDHTQLIYHHTSHYIPEQEAGISYRDPMLNLKLPMEPVVISQRDKELPVLDTHFNGIRT
jgi:dTDP-4-dehydrorhamnose 3,5-epimerase